MLVKLAHNERMTLVKKGLIVYFSGTGNTKFIATLFKEYFEKKEITCDCYDLLELEKFEGDYDFLVIAAPIHVDLYPKFFLETLREKLSFNKIPCLAVSTQAAESATPAFIDAAKILGDKVTIQYANRIALPNNFYNFMFKKTSTAEQARLKSAAVNRVDQMAEAFLAGKKYQPKIDKKRYYLAKFAYWATYSLYTPLTVKKISLDQSKCTQCKLCETNCPTQSISIQQQPCIAKSCVLCQRCLNSCPSNAFLYKNKAIDQYKF